MGETVTSAPAGIDCGSVCSARFATGTSVVLTANPDSTSTFAGWRGCDTVAGPQCTVAVTATSYSASALTPGATVIRAADVNELRSAVLALE